MKDENFQNFMPGQGQDMFSAMMPDVFQSMQPHGDMAKAMKLEGVTLAYSSRSPMIFYKGLLDLTLVLSRFVNEDTAVKLLEVAKEVKEKLKEELKEMGEEELAGFVDDLYYKIDKEYERLSGDSGGSVEPEGEESGDEEELEVKVRS